MNSEHLDEGVVHAWLDGQLSAPDAARIEAHIAGCAACAEMVAEARGFVAASSRILTGLDGVPARVVPRSRSRTRIWQVRAAAAVIVVAVGAAAVLSDTGGHFYQSRPDTRFPQPQAAASPGPAPAKSADSQAAAPAPAPSSSPPSSPALMKTRAVAPASPQQQMQQHEQQQLLQQKQLDDRQRENKKEAALNERDGAAQTGMLRDQTVAPARQDTPAAAPPPAMRSALAAKAAPSSAGGNAVQRILADSSASANMARAFSVRRLASNAAYGQCAGKVVTVSEPAGMNADAVPHLTTVRLDSAARRPPIRGFVLAAPGARTNLDGWWVPVGADSAVVSLANPEPATAAAVGDSAGADTTRAIPAVVTRVSCLSP